VVFVGRLSAEKGIKNLAEAAKLLGEYEFVVAGSGPDADALKNIGNVTMAGFLTGDELTELMANARALILPSVCYENCPLTILEAHALGVPVITMNSGGMAELVRDGITGTLVAEPTARSIADSIRKTFGDTEYYNNLKANCKKEKEKILSVEDYCSILIEKYNSIIKKG